MLVESKGAQGRLEDRDGKGFVLFEIRPTSLYIEIKHFYLHI
jgi:hypothetical protein